MSPVTFGKRVVGDDAYEKAVREEKGGAHVFGTRVRDAIPDGGPTNQAKRASEFGVRTTDGASFQDHTGKATDAVALDDLKNILAENPTFFDSLYEAELAREGGARPEALKVFQQIEIGIKGQGRRDVLDEINALLGEKSQQSAARANLATAQKRAFERQNERVARNSPDDGTENADTDRQVRAIADEAGLKLPQDVTREAANFKGEPAKPEGSVRPETQQTGSAILVPKGDGTSTGEGSTGEGTSQSGGAGAGEPDYESMTKAELEAEAAKLGVDPNEVKGTGSEGAILKGDLLKAVKKAAKKQASE
jgi:hypothetical protein